MNQGLQRPHKSAGIRAFQDEVSWGACVGDTLCRYGSVFLSVPIQGAYFIPFGNLQLFAVNLVQNSFLSIQGGW
jgi:hypothetical protein